MFNRFEDLRTRYLASFFRLLLGFFMVALGNVLTIYSKLGLSPWGVLHDGISLNSSLSFGQANQMVGLLIIVFCFFFNIIPGIGTILNMFFIGFFIDLINKNILLPIQHNIVYKLIILMIGIFMIALGTAIYIKENMGAGPRDSLMLLMCNILSIKISTARMASEFIAIFFGFLLGGKVGIGSILIAFTLGPVLKKILKLFKYDPKKNRQRNIIENLINFKNK